MLKESKATNIESVVEDDLYVTPKYLDNLLNSKLAENYSHIVFIRNGTSNRSITTTSGQTGISTSFQFYKYYEPVALFIKCSSTGNIKSTGSYSYMDINIGTSSHSYTWEYLFNLRINVNDGSTKINSTSLLFQQSPGCSLGSSAITQDRTSIGYKTYISQSYDNEENITYGIKSPYTATQIYWIISGNSFSVNGSIELNANIYSIFIVI